jgi:hypothetical protein
VTASVTEFQGGGAAAFEYSTDGVTWHGFTALSASQTINARVSIPIANLDQLELRVLVSGGAGPSGSVSIDGTINTWSVDVPTGSGAATANLRAYRYYTAGDAVTYGGGAWVSVMTDSGGVTVPGSNANIWAALPSDLTYEIPTPYAADDLAGIHYAQSADVLTLVHPNYPPAELRRPSPRHAPRCECDRVSGLPRADCVGGHGRHWIHGPGAHHDQVESHAGTRQRRLPPELFGHGRRRDHRSRRLLSGRGDPGRRLR